MTANNMRDVTISRHGDSYRITAWEDRDNPTESELHPEWAEKIIYTVLPHDAVGKLKGRTASSVHELLSILLRE